MNTYENWYDLIIIGGGPAGLTAAIYAARAKERVLVIEEKRFGGQLADIEKMVNYPGVKECGGQELAEILRKQAIDFGAKLIMEAVTEMELEYPVKIIKTNAIEYKALSVIIAIGAPDASYNRSNSLNMDCLDIMEEGYLLTDKEGRTNISGVSAAGDVRRPSQKQVILAASDGAIAAVGLESHIKKMHQDHHIPDFSKMDDVYQIQTGEKGILRIWLDDSKLAQDMLEFIKEKKELAESLIYEIHEEERDDILLPSMEICRPDGSSSGIHFHAVPMGMEWNSFRMALFNVLGPGQKIEEDVISRIKGIDQKINIKILATLTCGNCPTSVMSACQIAAYNENVTAEIFDITHFKKLRFRYQILSVPAMVINDDKFIIGKMNVQEMLDELDKSEV